MVFTTLSSTQAGRLRLRHLCRLVLPAGQCLPPCMLSSGSGPSAAASACSTQPCPQATLAPNPTPTRYPNPNSLCSGRCLRSRPPRRHFTRVRLPAAAQWRESHRGCRPSASAAAVHSGMQLVLLQCWGQAAEQRDSSHVQPRASPACSATSRLLAHALRQTNVNTQIKACLDHRAVLIDEAGQASEVAALQPLVFGAKRCRGWLAPAPGRPVC